MDEGFSEFMVYWGQVTALALDSMASQEMLLAPFLPASHIPLGTDQLNILSQLSACLDLCGNSWTMPSLDCDVTPLSCPETSSLTTASPDSNDIPQSLSTTLTRTGTERHRKRKRGRKPLRPQDPIKKKTEEKDKYWLRAFRTYMQGAYPDIQSSLYPYDQCFWRCFLSAAGKPGKDKR
jgi:hypothetical protein